MIPELSWDDLNTTVVDHDVNQYQHLASRVTLEDVEQLVV
tara:strand:+ start:1036 stop:1155 length:120 start_codon:yes stop_codon:yes gene_type:complete